MSHSSILGGERAATQSGGKDVDSLGPSDSSDSGSDVQGERVMSTRPDHPDELGAVPVELNSDSDAQGTGERASAEGNDGPEGADILPDRIIDPLDEADPLLDIDSDRADLGARAALHLAVAPRDGRNRDVERLEDDGDDEQGDPPDNPAESLDEGGPDPANTALERDAERTRQVMGGSRTV